MTDLQALAYAMKMEQEGAKYYHDFAGKCRAHNSKVMFEALAKMEGEHFSILEEQYDALSTGGTWLDIDLSKYAMPELFLDKGKEKVPNEAFESELSDIAILRMAYLMENDLADFYRDWASKVDNASAREFLLKLSQWENEHYTMLYKEFTNLIHENWFEMGFAPY